MLVLKDISLRSVLTRLHMFLPLCGAGAKCTCVGVKCAQHIPPEWPGVGSKLKPIEIKSALQLGMQIID